MLTMVSGGPMVVVTPMVRAVMVAPMGLVMVMPPRLDVQPKRPIVMTAVVDLLGPDRRRAIEARADPSRGCLDTRWEGEAEQRNGHRRAC